MAEEGCLYVTYTGGKSIRMAGRTFVKGKAVSVPIGDSLISRCTGNPRFTVSKLPPGHGRKPDQKPPVKARRERDRLREEKRTEMKRVEDVEEVEDDTGAEEPPAPEAEVKPKAEVKPTTPLTFEQAAAANVAKTWARPALEDVANVLQVKGPAGEEPTAAGSKAILVSWIVKAQNELAKNGPKVVGP